MADSNTMSKNEPRQSAVWLLVVLAVSVFIIEIMVMVLLPSLPPMSDMAKMMVDAAMLSLFLFPHLLFPGLSTADRQYHRAQDG